MQQRIEVRALQLGELATNCYILWISETHEGYVIDPAEEGGYISEVLLKEQIQLQGIIYTHGHFDHVLGSLELLLNFPVPVYMHPDDQFILERTTSTASHFLGRGVDPVPMDYQPLSDNQKLPLGSEELSIFHTPGHTPGSCCVFVQPKKIQLFVEHIIISEKYLLFTGDTLFEYGIEPLNHRYSSALSLSSSLEKLSRLPQETLVLPGHGGSVNLFEAVTKAKHS